MQDMERMIKEEIGRIGDLKERVAFKDIVEQVFLSLYETNREMYESLEERVMEDLAFDLNRCRICTAVVEREYVDQSHHLLAPMRKEDLTEKKPDAGQLISQCREQGSSLVKTLFLECDWLWIQKLLKKGKISGTIRTKDREYPAEFILRPNTAYLKEISHLYSVFIQNGVRWQTVNAPYLYKFADVYLASVPEGFGAEESIVAIEPDLGEYAGYARENLIPLWNIRKLELDSVGFPVPCEDHKSYEHTISIREYGREHVYLIEDREQIFHVRQKENRLLVMAKEPEGKRWQIYMIRSGKSRKFERFAYPLMTNQKKDEFVERFWRQQGQAVRTGAELARFIGGFELQEYVEYAGYEIKDALAEETPETYSMNGFILDEIRQPDFQKRLVLFFTGKKKTPFLERDIMSFLVSEVQLLYREYNCEGRLI